METAVKIPKTTTFRGIISGGTPEEIDNKIEEMESATQSLRNQKLAAEREVAEKLKEQDMKRLIELRRDLRRLNEVTQMNNKIDLEQALEITTKRDKIQDEIEAIETKYAIGRMSAQDFMAEKKGSIWPTVAGIAALVFVCWAGVVWSGNWILDKYPGAAIYNAVSFQKVIFGFSVFISEVAGAIVATLIFFPGLGKYFNPFNRDQLDFFNDFQKLTEWQRNIVSLFLFFALLLAFVLTVSGKLD